MDGRLVDYRTDAYLRPAREEEVCLSRNAVMRDGQKMLIYADNRICYIEKTPNPEPTCRSPK